MHFTTLNFKSLNRCFLQDDVTHEETRLCLGDGDRGEDFYAVNWNAGELVRVGLDESVRNVVGKSPPELWGVEKALKVVLQLFFVENVET